MRPRLVLGGVDLRQPLLRRFGVVELLPLTRLLVFRRRLGMLHRRAQLPFQLPQASGQAQFRPHEYRPDEPDQRHAQKDAPAEQHPAQARPTVSLQVLENEPARPVISARLFHGQKKASAVRSVSAATSASG